MAQWLLPEEALGAPVQQPLCGDRGGLREAHVKLSLLQVTGLANGT